MGASGISFGELLIVLVIALLIFGSGRLAKAGSDLGTAIRGFRKAMSEGEPGPQQGSPPGESTALLPGHRTAPHKPDPDTPERLGRPDQSART